MAGFTPRTYRIMNMLQDENEVVFDATRDNNMLLLNIPEVTDSLFTDELMEPTIFKDITAEVLDDANGVSEPNHDNYNMSVPDAENFQLQSSYSKECAIPDKRNTESFGASIQLLLSYPEENVTSVKCSTEAHSGENESRPNVAEGQSDSASDPDYIPDSETEAAVRNMETPDAATSSGNKRNKRHFVDERKWKDNDRKRKREKGEEYFGRNKLDGEWTYDTKREKKILQPPCNCKLSQKNTVLKCRTFSEVDRQNLFRHFWANMSWPERKVYVTMLVDLKSVKRHRNQLNETSSRTQSLVYHMKKGQDRVRVCKRMFLNTHSVKDNMILEWLKQTNQNNIIDDREESGEASKENVKTQRYRDLKENLRAFFNKLPEVESHYCRAPSSKLY